MDFIKTIEGKSLKNISLYNLRLYNIKQKNVKGWANANSIPRSYLELNNEKTIKICLSFNKVSILLESNVNEILAQETNLKETEHIDFTYDSEGPPVMSYETFKIENHLCYDDLLINVLKIENKGGLSGYSFQFASQEMISIYPDEEFLLVEPSIPEGFWKSRI